MGKERKGFDMKQFMEAYMELLRSMERSAENGDSRNAGTGGKEERK